MSTSITIGLIARVWSGVPSIRRMRQVPASRRGHCAAPCRTSIELPLPVRSHLPPHTQDIYREAFNHAHAAHAGDPRQEETARRIAWAAVKRSYAKIGDEWVRMRRPGGRED